MSKLNTFSNISTDTVINAAKRYGTPIYIYDEQIILDRCKALISMPNAFGLKVRYAMKANSNKTILNIISSQGLHIDASSLNEARRANLAGINLGNIILTTQEVPTNKDLLDLQDMMKQGLKYNVCSLKQLYNIADFAVENNICLSMRVHPGVGSGESATRNTGDHYSCFGIHLTDIEQALEFSKEKGIIYDQVHVHIGSGADPAIWQSNIAFELELVDKYFPDATKVSFGGGLKEARMPDEESADIYDLGKHAKNKVEEFYQKTGRKLEMEVEPGTYIVANCGYAVTTVIDKKQTGPNGFNFIILDGGMEINTRPLLYASRHPFYVISKSGKLLSSEFDIDINDREYEAAVIGRCCESGDSQSLTEDGFNVARKMTEPDFDDYVVIGGTGAYCSTMSPMNYNSHLQIPEILFTKDGKLKEIRKRQTIDQLIANEI